MLSPRKHTIESPRIMETFSNRIKYYYGLLTVLYRAFSLSARVLTTRKASNNSIIMVIIATLILPPVRVILSVRASRKNIQHPAEQADRAATGVVIHKGIPQSDSFTKHDVDFFNVFRSSVTRLSLLETADLGLNV